jgi:hypothetical protein
VESLACIDIRSSVTRANLDFSRSAYVKPPNPSLQGLQTNLALRKNAQPVDSNRVCSFILPYCDKTKFSRRGQL